MNISDHTCGLRSAPLQQPQPTAAMQTHTRLPLAMRSRHIRLACCVALAWLAVSPRAAQAQIVQLPSLHNFSSTGSALIPDGGTALLGASGRFDQGSIRSGSFPQSSQAMATSVGESTLSASVQVIDLDALDQAILAGATPRTIPAEPAAAAATAATGAAAVGAAQIGDSDDVRQRARLSSRYADRTRQLSANDTEQVGADPGKWQRVLSGGSTPIPVNASMVESNVRYYVELGQQAERSGSLQASRVYYRLARQAMTPELVAQYEQALRARAADAAARSAAEQEQARRKF